MPKSYIAQTVGGSYRATRTREVLRASRGIVGFAPGNFLFWPDAGLSSLTMPFLLSVFGRWHADEGAGVMMGVVYSPTLDQDIRVREAENDAAAITEPSAGGFLAANDGVIPLGEEFHCAGAFISSSDRRVWFEGAEGINTDSGEITTLVELVTIGISGIDTGPWAGALSSASIWDLAGMSDSQIAALVSMLKRGAHPIELDGDEGAPWAGKLYRLNGKVAYGQLTSPGSVGPWSVLGSTLRGFDSNRGSRAVMMQTRLRSKRMGLGRWVVS